MNSQHMQVKKQREQAQVHMHIQCRGTHTIDTSEQYFMPRH